MTPRPDLARTRAAGARRGHRPGDQPGESPQVSPTSPASAAAAQQPRPAPSDSAAETPDAQKTETSHTPSRPLRDGAERRSAAAAETRTRAEARVDEETPVKGPAGRRAGAAARRLARQQEIVAATRALFDQREMRDANIDDIARAVGVNRAIIYRHFASKDELFALTLAEYLTELEERLRSADGGAGGGSAPQRLTDIAGAYADFCLEYPAFLDCALALLRQPGNYLITEVSEAVLQQLGRKLVACLGIIAEILRDGTRTGDFAVDDVDLTANMIYLQTLGSLHLARTGFMVRDTGSGTAEVRNVDEHQFRSLVIRAVLAAARA